MCLHHALLEMPQASVEAPSCIYLQDVGCLAGVLYGKVMTGCVGITDGSLHPLENGLWILGDVTFARVSGRVERV
jgi:hypothetical protein